MVFSLLLVAICLFLRKLEFTSLEDSNFNQEMFVMAADNIVEALNLKVLGKAVRDKDRGLAERFEQWRCLCLWSNDEAPDLDPVRHLLAHLWIIGWKGGSLFPSFEELANPPADGICKTKMTEDDLCSILMPICKDVLEREEKLGSHTARKTGHLFAALMGCTHVAFMMLGANHKCPKVAKDCIQDAMGIVQVCNTFNDRSQKVGAMWRSPHSLGGENAVLTAQPGAQWQKPLAETVEGFITSVVGISVNHTQCRKPVHVHERVSKWRKNLNDPSRSLMVSESKHLKHLKHLKCFEVSDTSTNSLLPPSTTWAQCPRTTPMKS